MTEGFIHPSVDVAAGKASNEAFALLASSSGSNIINGGGLQIGQIIDVRQWASFYLSMDAIVVPNPATGYNQINPILFWTDDLIGTNTLYSDSYNFWADTVGGAGFGVSLGTAYMQDIMHGPYLRLNIANNGPDQVSTIWRLYGTTRVFPGPYARQENGVDGVLLSDQQVLNGGGQIVVPMPLSYGDTEFIIFNKSINPTDFSLLYSAAGDDHVQKGIAANTLISVRHFLPKRGAILQFDGTAGQTVSYRVIADYNKF